MYIRYKNIFQTEDIYEVIRDLIAKNKHINLYHLFMLFKIKVVTFLNDCRIYIQVSFI